VVVLSTTVVVNREEIRVRRSGGSGSGMAPPSVFFAFFPIFVIFTRSSLFLVFFAFSPFIMGILNGGNYTHLP